METAASVTTDLTTCSICIDMLDNPKSLPCLHAFCLKCLQANFKDACTRDEVPCPVCRKDFEIPSEGLNALQHHFFAQRLVDVRKASTEDIKEAPCEVCLQDNEEGSNDVPTATMYCVDCNEKLCNQCSKPHRYMKDGAHQVKPVGADAQAELIHVRGSSCDKHEDEQVKLYCCDCKENICLICSAVNHSDHHRDEIPNVAANFRRTMNDEGAKVLSAIDTVRYQSLQATQTSAEFASEVEGVQNMIVAAGDEIRRSLDDQISEILTELQKMKKESDKQAEHVKKTYELALLSLKSFHTYTRELLEKGRPCDITRAAPQLHDRATELLGNDISAVKYQPPHVTFTPADVTHVNLIGTLTSVAQGQPGETLIRCFIVFNFSLTLQFLDFVYCIWCTLLMASEFCYMYNAALSRV